MAGKGRIGPIVHIGQFAKKVRTFVRIVRVCGIIQAESTAGRGRGGFGAGDGSRVFLRHQHLEQSAEARIVNDCSGVGRRIWRGRHAVIQLCYLER